MSIISYQVFVAVVEQGSFLKASHLLSITPSAVSHSIAALETEFGYPLLTRGKNGVCLTGYGETIMPYVRAVLNQEGILRQQVTALNGLETGTVRMGVFNSICNTHIPKIVKQFQEGYPNIRIQIYQGTYSDILYWLKNGVVEIGFLSAESAKNEVPFTSIYQDELLCIVPENQAVSTNDHITHEELEKFEFVAQQETTDSDIQNYLKKHQVRVKVNSYVNDDESAISLVSNGFGICIVPELIISERDLPVKLYSLHPKGYREIGVSSFENNLSPAAIRLRDFIIKGYEEKKFERQ